MGKRLDKPVSLALKSGNFGDDAFFHEPKESFYHERFRKSRAVFGEEMTRIASSFFQRGYATGSLAICRCFYLTGIYWRHRQVQPGQSRSAAAFQSRRGWRMVSGDKPSKEVLFHLALYRNNPAVKRWCICTAHGRRRFPACKAGQQQRYSSVHTIRGDADGNVPLVPYYRPGDKRIAQDLANWQQTIRLFYWQIMAQWFAVKPARSRQQYGRAGGNGKADFILGDRPIRYLTAGEIAELRVNAMPRFAANLSMMFTEVPLLNASPQREKPGSMLWNFCFL